MEMYKEQTEKKLLLCMYVREETDRFLSWDHGACIVIARAISEKAYLTTDGARSHHIPWVDVTSSDGVMC